MTAGEAAQHIPNLLNAAFEPHEKKIMKESLTTGTGHRKSGRDTLPDLPDVREIAGYAHWLVMRGQLAGNLRLDGHAASDEEQAVASGCRTLCGALEERLVNCREADIADLLPCYDLVYRLGYSRVPDPVFVGRHRVRFFESWRRGNREIEESDIFGMIAPDARYRPEKAGRERVDAYRSILGRWMATLRRHGHFPGATSCENYRRLALVMREDIDIYFGGDGHAAKRGWYDLNRVDELSTLGPYILRGYRRFASSLYPDILDYERHMELDNRILSELAASPGLNLYERRAFLLALRYNREMAADGASPLRVRTGVGSRSSCGTGRSHT